jgi:hypothetical protein
MQNCLLASYYFIIFYMTHAFILFAPSLERPCSQNFEIYF